MSTPPPNFREKGGVPTRLMQKVFAETTSLGGIKYQKRSDAGLKQMDQLRAGLSKCCRILLLIFIWDV